MLQVAITAGKRLEMCYSTGLMGDAKSRVNLISNATQLIRATKGRGLLMSSGGEGGGRAAAASAAAGLRGPWDVINLAAVWGLGQEKGFEAMSKEPRGIVVRGKLKRTGYRGAVDVIYGGEKPAVALGKDDKEAAKEAAAAAGGAAGKGKQKWKKQGGQQKNDGNQQQAQGQGQGQKRKAEGEVPSSESGEQPMSKRQQKKLAHAARVANGTAGPAAASSGPAAASAG